MRWIILMGLVACGGQVVVDQPAETEGTGGAAVASVAASTGAGGSPVDAGPECVWSLETCCTEDTCCEVVGPAADSCEWIRVPGCILGVERCGDECAVRDACWNGQGACRTEPIPSDPEAYWVVCDAI